MAITGSAKREPLFSFPHPVNEVSARIVAGGVVILASAAVLVNHYFEWPWLMVPLAYGFWARVLTGPKLSPLGTFVTRVLVPALGNPTKRVAGPPKRFAQGVGVLFSTTALVLEVGFGLSGAAHLILGGLIFAATLESVFAFCLGCQMFAILMRVGVIPESVCRDCAQYSSTRLRSGSSAG
jgi:hypothetical protein